MTREGRGGLTAVLLGGFLLASCITLWPDGHNRGQGDPAASEPATSGEGPSPPDQPDTHDKGRGPDIGKGHDGRGGQGHRK